MAFKKDFVASYNQTVFGFLWSLVLPIIPLSVYIILAHFKVLKTTQNMPYVVYIVTGLTIWFLMASTILAVMISIQKERNILSKIPYPMIAVMIANFGKVIYEFIVRSLLIVLVLFAYGLSPSAAAVYLLIMIIPLLLFCLGLGMILAVLNEVYKDIKNFVEISLRYGIFISSTIFPLPERGLIASINVFNPFNTYVVSLRSILILGTIDNMKIFMITAIFSMLLFVIACKLVFILEYRIKANL